MRAPATCDLEDSRALLVLYGGNEDDVDTIVSDICLALRHDKPIVAVQLESKLPWPPEGVPDGVPETAVDFTAAFGSDAMYNRSMARLSRSIAALKIEPGGLFQGFLRHMGDSPTRGPPAPLNPLSDALEERLRNLSVDEVADLLLGADLLPQTVENFRRRGINGTLLIEASQSKGDCERLLGKQTEYFRRKLQFLLREWKKELAAPATGAARSLKYKCVESMRSEAVCFWLRRLGFPEMIIDKFQLNRVCGSEMIIMSEECLRVDFGLSPSQVVKFRRELAMLNAFGLAERKV